MFQERAEEEVYFAHMRNTSRHESAVDAVGRYVDYRERNNDAAKPAMHKIERIERDASER